MASLSSDTRLAKGRDTVSCDLGDGTAILRIGRPAIFELEGVGSRVWELLAEPLTMNELTRKLLAEYRVDRAELERDLMTLLEDLVRRGLIEVASSTPLLQ